MIAIMSVLQIFFRILFWCIPSAIEIHWSKQAKLWKCSFPMANFRIFRLMFYNTFTLHTCSYAHNRGRTIYTDTCMWTTDMCLVYWRHTKIAPVYWIVIEKHTRIASVTDRTDTRTLSPVVEFTNTHAHWPFNWTERNETRGRKRNKIRKKVCTRNHFVRVFRWIHFLLLFSRLRISLLLFLNFFSTFSLHSSALLSLHVFFLRDLSPMFQISNKW